MNTWAFTGRKDFAEVAGTVQGNSPRLQMLAGQVQGLRVDSGAVVRGTGASWARISVKGLSGGRGEECGILGNKSPWHPVGQSLVPGIDIWIKVEKPETELAETGRKGQSLSQLDWVHSWLLAQQRIEAKTGNRG